VEVFLEQYVVSVAMGCKDSVMREDVMCLIYINSLGLARLVLDLATLEGHKAELTQLAGYTPRWYTHLKMVTIPVLTGPDAEQHC